MPVKMPYSPLNANLEQNESASAAFDPSDDFDDENDENLFLLKELRNVQDFDHKLNKEKSTTGGAASGGFVLRSRGSWKNFAGPGSASGQRSSSAGPVGNALTPAGGVTGGDSSTGGSGTGSNFVFVERKIRKDDSLRNLALQYGISVQDLKRLNGLLSDQEFYGRDVIKIPVNRYSIHNFQRGDDDGKDGEANLVDLPSTSRGFSVPPTSNEFVDLNLDTGPNNNANYSTSVPNNGKNAAVSPSASSDGSITTSPDKFLKNLDENLSKVKKSQQEMEERKKLQQQTAESGHEEYLDDRDVFATAARNWSIRRSWWQRNVTHFVIVVLLIFVAIVVPLVIVLYKIVNAVEGNDVDESREGID